MENKVDIAEYIEQTCMEIIANAGEGRAHVFEALEHVLKEDYQSAKAALDEGEQFLQQAHSAQFTKLMAYQLNGNEVPFSIIILHAMDLLMVATSERDLLKCIVNARLSGGTEQ